MIEGITVEAIKLPFSKGMVTDYGAHLMPPEYSPYSKNVRIRNSTITRRKGYVKVASVNNNTPVNKLISAQGKLFAVVGSTFYEVNVSTGVYTQKMTEVWDDVHVVVFGNYIILCNWEDDGRVFDIWDDVEVPMTHMYENAKPRFWESFQYATYLVWGGSNKNMLYKSMEWGGAKIEWEDPEDEWDPKNVYNYTGDWTVRYEFKSDITGIVANREKLFVFTEDSIEVCWTAESPWGYITLVFQPIAWTNVPANPNMIVKADDLIFFWTKDNMMKSIGYVSWISELVVWDVSYTKDLSIKMFTDTLDEDQSDAIWYYNRTEKTVHRHLKQKGETTPNVVLVYDLNTQSFFIDTNKFFKCQVNHGSQYYVGDAFVQTIYEDGIWDTDNWNPIQRERRTALLTMGSPDYRKEFRQVNVYWEKDDDVEISVYILVDGKEVFEWVIEPKWLPVSWTASKPLASKPIAFEYEQPTLKTFEYLVSKGFLRHQGKNIQIIFRGESTWDFCLSGLEVGFRNLYNSNPSDRGRQKS